MNKDVKVVDIRTLLNDDEPFRDGMRKIVCPRCGFDHVHLDAPTLQPSDDYSAWTGRGCAIRIPCRCEGGCEFNILLGFHKGQSFIGVEDAGGAVSEE